MTKFLLDVEDNLWSKFKDSIPRSKSLNSALVGMIKKFVERERK